LSLEKLSLRGKAIAHLLATAILNRLQPPPSVVDLRAEMERRRQKHTERMRQLGLKNLGPACTGSPAQQAAVRALRAYGPLTQRRINEVMEIKFKNPRSLDLALRQMEKRAVVRRARDFKGNLRIGPDGAQLWEYIETSNSSEVSRASGVAPPQGKTHEQ